MCNITPLKLAASVFMLSLSFWPMATVGNDLRDFDHKVDPIEVSGHALPSMIGAPTENIRVYASRNNTLSPIPFQIDQKNASDDWVWTAIPKSGERPVQTFDDKDSDIPLTRSKNLGATNDRIDKY